MCRGLLLYSLENFARNRISQLLSDMADQADRAAYDCDAATKSPVDVKFGGKCADGAGRIHRQRLSSCALRQPGNQLEELDIISRESVLLGNRKQPWRARIDGLVQRMSDAGNISELAQFRRMLSLSKRTKRSSWL